MQENIREILNQAIEDNLEKLSKLYVIRDVAQEFDGKLFNKSFITRLEKDGGIYGSFTTKSDGDRKLEIFAKNVKYPHHTLIHVYSLSEVTKDKRLIAQKLIKIVNDNIASCQEDINKLQRDLFDGEKRFQEWNALAKRMDEILYSFSYTFREANRYNFERVTKP